MTPRRPGPRPARDRGAALILVIWAIGLMAVMAALVARDAQLDARESHLARESLSARLLAESGVRLALERLDSPAGAATDAFPFVCDMPEGRIAADIRPAGALIDINAAQEDLLAALFMVLGASQPEAESAAARIADYRDADATPRPGGAEGPDYRRAGLNHGPANRPFSRTGELSEVLGLRPQLLQAALPHLTASSYSVRTDPALATPEVRAALELFGAEPLPGLDQDAWEIGAAGGNTARSTGAVVVRILATTQAGQNASFAATYGTPPRQGVTKRPLVEEHPAGRNLYLAANARLPEPRPCF